jgi:GH43 family beta-xylosidase
MMTAQHPSLAAGRWQTFSLVEQLANIGSEVERALNWLNKSNPEYSRLAFLRALELLGLTIADPRNLRRLKELTRLREALLDFFLGDNEFHSTEKSWRGYFYAFAYASALEKSRGAR